MRLVCDAIQHLRTQLRWKVIDDQNKAIKKAKEQGLKYKAEILTNGDTLGELLVRSKYLMYKYENNWTLNQKKRTDLLFAKYPQIKQAYDLCIGFRNIYKCVLKQQAIEKFIDRKNKVQQVNIKEFNNAVNSIEHHFKNIMIFFNNRITNANAESFNSKIKNFRANLRGVTDIKFLLFRLQKIFV